MGFAKAIFFTAVTLIKNMFEKYIIVDLNGKGYNGNVYNNQSKNFTEFFIDHYKYTRKEAKKRLKYFPQFFAGCQIRKII